MRGRLVSAYRQPMTCRKAFAHTAPFVHVAPDALQPLDVIPANAGIHLDLSR
jgi:hypothetical protein